MTFEGSGAGSKPGLEIWRIENLQPVRVSEETFGSFYSGDCYLVLYTYKRSERSAKLDMDLHYWQGEKSSQDERGASAYRTVELDDYLKGVPVQHREVQGHESAKFLAYFPKGIQYLEGGVDSAFRIVDPNAYQPRLFHVKGKRNVRCVQVEFKVSSLNDGDVFILDNGLTIYQWNGASANRQEKFKALEVATKIKDKERGGKAKLVFLESNSPESDAAPFFALLGGSRAEVKHADQGGDDEQVREDIASLWRVSDSTGTLQMTEVARGKLEKKMLDEGDVFILDAGGEVFVWIGKNASKEERSKGMQYGADYILNHNKPSWTPLTRLPSGGESIQFKAKFHLFDQEYIAAQEETYVAKERKMELDALLSKQRAAEAKMIDDGSGQVTVWRIDNLQKVLVDPKQHGQFNSGDTYIVLYRYKNRNLDSYLLYMWIGRNSRADEKAAMALLTVEIAGTLGDLPGAQVRVVQNREPAHFLALFRGKMVVRATAGGDGAASSSFGGDVRLFHVRGTNAIDTRAVEVAPTATSLNSADCFVLLSGGQAFVWRGTGSNEEEKRGAAALTQAVLAEGRAVQEIEEGQEPAAFFEALGGKAPYANAKHLQAAVIEPRLFQISGRTGNFKAEELVDFSQDDLVQDGVFLLDTVAEVYVWLGNSARADDKDAAMAMALQYVERAPDGRSPETPVFRVVAGAEPPTFTAQFRGWSAEAAADFQDPYQRKVQEMMKSQQAATSSSSAPAAAPAKPPSTGSASAPKPAAAAVAPAPAAASAAASGSAPGGKVFSLAELKAGTPAGVDPTKKQDFLSDADFKAALGVDRAAFAALAGWKQADLKKKAGIF